MNNPATKDAPVHHRSRRGRIAIEDGPDPIDVQVGRRLRQARLIMGLSQEELGDGIGVSFQAVQKYEHGENRISASRMHRAAKLLGRPVSFFFEGMEDASVAPAVGDAFSRDEAELVRSYRLLANDEVRRHFLAIMKSIASIAERASEDRYTAQA